jgi:hypothetical protein
MRGKITDQDLTDYALNELPPNERLYVESMLGVSEECRGDVYQMLDLGEMLKEGFEEDERKDELGAALLLNEEQRAKVLDVPRWNWMHFLRQAAAIALLAGGTAYVASRPDLWGSRGTNDQYAVSGVSGQGYASSPEELTNRTMAASALAETPESDDLQFVMSGPAVCTPPVLGDMPEVAGM